MEKIGIYVHIPFCAKKCFYCDFISYVGIMDKQKEYIRALKHEIVEKSKNINNKIDTIYIGGGTPSIINEIYIEEILECIKNNYSVVKDAEITIEVNPGTITKNKLQVFKKNGINRLSIGLQSTNNQLLEEIGRIHTYKDFLKNYKLARKVGFSNINIDLIIGLPNQTLEDVEETILKIIGLNPEHISVYSLILEENTKLKKLVEDKVLQLCDEDLERNMYWKVKKILEKNGYNHYEISNYAKPDYMSKHNLNCWKQHHYLGMGISAHSYYNNIRFSNTNNIEEYIRYKYKGEIEEKQNMDDIKREYMLLGLRTIDGVKISEFKNKFGDNPVYLFRNELNKLVQEKLIEINLDSIVLTDRGIDLANIVWMEFV